MLFAAPSSSTLWYSIQEWIGVEKRLTHVWYDLLQNSYCILFLLFKQQLQIEQYIGHFFVLCVHIQGFK